MDFLTTKRLNLILVLICLISFFLSATCIHKGHHLGSDDFALYIEQAKCIVEGGTSDLYLENKYSMDNSVELLGPYLYPQGFPLLISPLYFFFGANFLVIKCFLLICFTGSLFLIYNLFANKFKNKTTALVLVTGIAFHPEFIIFGDNILSDFPFLFFSILSLLFIERSLPTFLHQMVLSGLLIFTFCIREAGVFILVVLFVYQINGFLKEGGGSIKLFLNRILKEKWRALPYAAFLFFFFIKRYYFVDTSANHLKELTQTSSAIIKQNLLYYSEITTSLIPLDLNLKWKCLLFFIPIFTGIVFYFKNYLHYLVYILFIGLLYIVWPAQQGLRFLYPICPLLLFFFLKGIEKLGETKWKNAIMTIYVIIVVTAGILEAKQYAAQDNNEFLNEETYNLQKFIANHTNRTDLIVFFKPRALHLLTNRDSFLKWETEDILASKASYFLEYNASGKRDSLNFKPVYKSKRFTLYKVIGRYSIKKQQRV